MNIHKNIFKKSKTLSLLKQLLSISMMIAFHGIYAQVQTAKYISMTPLSNAYYEYLPQGYSTPASQKYPLMIFVHGSGETGDGSPSQLTRVLRTGPLNLLTRGFFQRHLV